MFFLDLCSTLVHAQQRYLLEETTAANGKAATFEAAQKDHCAAVCAWRQCASSSAPRHSRRRSLFHVASLQQLPSLRRGHITSKGLTPEQAAELENRRGPMRAQHPHRAFRSQNECRPWDSLNPQPALAGASRPRCSPSSQLSRYSSCWSASRTSWHISLATRARDVGIRMALGAERSDVMLLVQKKTALLRWVSSPGSSPRGSRRATFRRFSLESGARSNHNLVCLRFARRLRFARGPDSCSAVRLRRSHAGTSDGVGKTLLGATGFHIETGLGLCQIANSLIEK